MQDLARAPRAHGRASHHRHWRAGRRLLVSRAFAEALSHRRTARAAHQQGHRLPRCTTKRRASRRTPMDAPYGLSSRDVADTAQQVVLPGGRGKDTSALLIHPERLMESRVHNVIGLGQDRAQAIAQLRAAIECAGAFSHLILDADEPGPVVRRRAVLKLNERIYRFSRRPPARRLFRERGIDTFDAVVSDHPKLPRKFREVRYPQMRSQLAELPERRKRGWTP